MAKYEVVKDSIITNLVENESYIKFTVKKNRLFRSPIIINVYRKHHDRTNISSGPTILDHPQNPVIISDLYLDVAIIDYIRNKKDKEALSEFTRVLSDNIRQCF